jgi:hypothetical protein
MFAAAVPLAISGISALAGMFANRAKKAEQTSSQTIDQTDMPQYDDKTLYMRNQLMDTFLDRLRSNEDFFGGYTNEGLKNINTSSDIAKRSLDNILAARGLSGSSAGASSAMQQRLNSLNQQSSFLNSIPLLRDQRAQQNLTGASGFFNALPTGTRRTGTTTGTGTATQPSNILGGGLTSLGTSLAGLYGQGAFGGPKPWWTQNPYINSSTGGASSNAGAGSIAMPGEQDEFGSMYPSQYPTPGLGTGVDPSKGYGF